MAKESPDIARLCTAVMRSRLVLRYPRQKRTDMVRQFVGAHYSEDASFKQVPINLMALYVSIVGRKLIANNPRVMLSTWEKANKPTVSAMQTWVNKEIVEMRLAETFGRVVTDSLFSMGITKVGLATPADSARHTWKLGAGHPFAERVDLDDFVFDIHARDFSEVSFIGHRFRVPLRVVRESKIYSKGRKEIQGMEDRIYNLEGDERVSVIGRTTLGADQEEFEEHVDLWEIFLPRHNLVITLADDNLTGPSAMSDSPIYGKALRIQKWLGPEGGPYHILGMQVVPGNPMPVGPLMQLYDLHMFLNRTMRKLFRQADRQKENVFVKGGAAEDGTRVMDADDGVIVRVDNPDNLKTVIRGGPNPANFQMFTALKDVFSWMAGNLEIMGGLAPQSKTASQDNLMNQNSSATISEMQDRTITHVSEVIKALCWYWHHDPYKVMKSEVSVPSLPSISVVRKTGPQDRQKIPFEDLQIAVDPYSLQHQTPQGRLQAINQVIQQIYTPMAQLAQQAGIMLDFQAYFKLVAKYLDQPDLEDILTMQQPPQQETMGQGSGNTGGAGPKPAETTRTYERRSLGGETPQGRAQEVGNQMAAAAASQNGNGKPQ